ncbi:medium-chain acyl-CoA ligase ACSF2, mitochondrial-like [Physella acuta]|uniref:medium-chain acyl-CoA ligase ACSF2, mitochondrial-like n=1 Tax=Physella acuta TaxID=109671 RepID=UPI0027DBCFE6|nr:medium-chain acyl-CoA ligase ACSF2, mitochondrial-like [Physella acuta]
MEWMAGFPSLYLGSGATTIVQEYLDSSATMNIVDLWNIACDEGADAAMLVPIEIMDLKKAFDNGTVTRRIKRIIIGAMPIKRFVFDLVDVICDEYMAIYGSTDLGYTVLGLVTGDMKNTVKDCYTGDRLVGGTQMKIVDEITNMEITSKNRTGKLFFKGGTVLRRYMGVESSTTAVFTDDGWFDSNDVGYIDESGGLVVIGRTSDYILAGFTVVHPQWLEESIIKCPGVASVVVVGISHPVRFQELCVCVVREKHSNLTEQDLKEFCKKIFFDTHISPEEVPEKFFFTDSFPHTFTGKVRRKMLEKMAAEHFQN